MYAITCTISGTRYVLVDGSGGLVPVVGNFQTWLAHHRGIWFNEENNPRRCGAQSITMRDIDGDIPGRTPLYPLDDGWLLNSDETLDPQQLALVHMDRQARIPMTVSEEMDSAMQKRIALPPTTRPALTVLPGRPVTGSDEWWATRA